MFLSRVVQALGLQFLEGIDDAEIYHTNVMMHVGTETAVVCMEAIRDPEKRSEVRESLEKTGKTIVDISFDQMNHFAGNMLELRNKDGEPCLVMSLTAYESLTQEQIGFLESKMYAAGTAILSSITSRRPKSG